MSEELSFPGEVVTKALVRVVDLPGAGRMALITLDNGHDHTKPNTLGPASLTELDEALSTAYAMPGVVAVGITSKPFIFAAGADLKGVTQVRTRDQALHLAQLGHRVLRRLGEGPVPSFAFVNGLALGGGLEVALHCTYRTVSASVAGVGLPECMIGLVPGWGGAYLLPRRIGIDAAVTLILEDALNQGRMTSGPAAAKMGLADAVFEAADFLSESLRWAARVLNGDVVVDRSEVDLSEATWVAALTRGREIADEKVHGVAPAPYRALQLLGAARTSSRDEGFAAEDEALADLFMSEETRASLYASDLVRRRAKRPAGVPAAELARPVSRVGIVGAGLMASQLAVLMLRRLEVPVIMSDVDQARVDAGLTAVRREIDRLLAKGRTSEDRANRWRALISGTTDVAAFAGADFVIEAVFEEMKVKQQVFADLEAVVGTECVLATNTSALSVSEMAAPLAHPDRVVGFHFFNPVAVMPLLEIARAERTDDATLATAFAVGRALKKSAVLVADAPGFVVNRLLLRMLGEIMAAIDEGTPVATAEAAMAPLGLPMPPMVLLQLVGPAVALHVAETLHEAFPQRFGVSSTLQRLVAAGKPGVWSWGADGPYIDAETAALLESGNSPSTAAQLRERALWALAEEAKQLLVDGVVASPLDIDLCMLLGAGWPFHLGGITPYLDREGIAEQVTGDRFLPRGVASVPAAG